MPAIPKLSVKALIEIVDGVSTPVFVKDHASRIIVANKACEDLWGVPFSNVQMTVGHAFFPENQLDSFLAKDREVFQSGETADFKENVWNNTLRQNRIVRTSKKPIYDLAGDPLLLICTSIDITEQEKADEELIKKGALLVESQRMAKMGSWHLDLRANQLDWSDAIFQVFEISRDDFGGTYEAFLDLCHPDDRESVHAAYSNSVSNRTPYKLTHRLLTPNGHTKWVEEICATEYDDSGVAVASRGTVQDITEHKKIEIAMRVTSVDLQKETGEAFYQVAVQKLSELTESDMAFICLVEDTQPETARILAMVDGGNILPEFTANLAGTPCLGVLSAGFRTVTRNLRSEYPKARFLHQLLVDSYSGSALYDRAGRPVGAVAVMSRSPMRDSLAVENVVRIFSSAVAATIEREKGQRRYRDLFEFSPDGLLMVDKGGKILLANHQAESIFGWTQAEMVEKSVEMLVPLGARERHSGQRDKYFQAPTWQKMSAKRRVLKGLRKDGTTFPAEIDLAPMMSDHGTMVAASVRDVSEQRRLEEQLIQATKMEAVGQLTAGMAHDFNNLLGIIIGNLDLAAERASADPILKTCFGSALDAALRGAKLTRRMVAFSRSQALSAATIDLNAAVLGFRDVLTATLGDTIQLRLNLAADLWPGLIDAAQLDESLLNLAINARDAMPHGGVLEIVTTNLERGSCYEDLEAGLEPGKFVVLTITDTGCGMPPEVVERVFEPFFTTKSAEKGGGLGLSMVQGFIKQSGGHVRISSRVGHGTSVSIFIPHSDQDVSSPAAEPLASPSVTPASDGLTVLVVEDSEILRSTSASLFRSLGYRTLEAENGPAALALLSGHPEIRLLFSDIMMPGGITGLELAREARRRHPGLEVILTSGLMGTAKASFSQIEEFDTLAKPFRRSELTAKLEGLFRKK